jgi:hypothetical protein
MNPGRIGTDSTDAHVVDSHSTRTRRLLERAILKLRSTLWSRRWTIIVHSVLLCGLLLSIFRTYLGSDGLLLYRDWVWPLSLAHPNQIVNVYDPGLWSNAGPDPEGYTRAASSWPVVWLSDLGLGSVRVEQAFVIYAFVVAYLLTFTSATVFIKWARVTGTPFKIEAIRSCFVVVSFANPAALQWLAGMYYTALWSIPILQILFFTPLLAGRLRTMRLPVFSGLALGLGATLDPRIWFWGFVILVPLYVFVIVSQTSRAAIVRQAVITVFLSLPGAILAGFSYLWTGLLSSPVRANTSSVLATVSSNASFPNVLRLQGYWWSLITYAPPSLSILPGGQSLLPSAGLPAFEILPGEAVTFVWLGTLYLIPIVAFACFFNAGVRRRAVPFVCIAVVGIAVASGTNWPFGFLASGELAAGNLPAIGPIFQTIFAGPWYAQTVTEAAFVVLIMLTMIAAVDFRSEFGLRIWRNPPSERSGSAVKLVPPTGVGKRRGALLVVLLVVILLFSSWQLFTGSLYPAGYSPDVSPNGIPSAGAIQGSTPPAADLTVYNQLSSNASSFNVDWPGPATMDAQGPFAPGLADYSYLWNGRSSPSLAMNSPKPFANPPGLTYLIAHDDTQPTSALLSEFGVKFVVVDNMTSDALEQAFGVKSIPQILSFFKNCSNLALIGSYPPTTWVFENEAPATTVYAGQTPVIFESNPMLLGVGNAALAELNLTPVYLAPGAFAGSYPALVGDLPRGSNRSITVLTGTNLSEASIQLRNLSHGGVDATRAGEGIDGESLSLGNGAINFPLWGEPQLSDVAILVNGSVRFATSNTSSPISKVVSSTAANWRIVPNVFLGPGALASLTGTGQVGGLVVLPSGLLENASIPQVTVRASGTLGYRIILGSSGPFFLVLSQEYSSHWIASESGGSVSTAIRGGVTSYTAFRAEGLGATITIQFEASALLPIVLVAYVAFNLLAAAAVIDPLSSKLRRNLARFVRFVCGRSERQTAINRS